MSDAYRNENEAAFAKVEALRQENERLRDELASVEQRLRTLEQRGASTLVLPSPRSRARQAWFAGGAVVAAFVSIAAGAALRLRQPESAGPVVIQGPVVFKASTAREPPEPSPVLDPPPAPRPATRDPPLGDQGLLSVICIPGCDAVYDNGTLLGPSPVFKRPATLGSHKIKLVLTNPPATKTISTVVVADQVSMVRESMP